jgi:hypothetical protein
MLGNNNNKGERLGQIINPILKDRRVKQVFSKVGTSGRGWA